MWYFLLLMLIILLLICLVFLLREIRSIADQLEDLSENRTRKKISTSLNGRIGRLCILINKNLAAQEQAKINLKNHEEKLKQSIANLSHDLRTPLTSILGYLSMMKEDQFKKNKINTNQNKTSEYLTIIEHRAKILNSLINEFYELSVIDDDDYQLELEKINITEVLTNSILGHYALFQERGIKPEIRIAQQAFFVIGNSDAYERVFANLISNALKFSAGDISVTLETKENYCLIKVSNPTTLLNDEDASHLFDRFYTADKSRSGQQTGIGLFIVKTLVEKMGGEIRSIFSNGIFEVIIQVNC